ncbi:BQ5605_C005g03665 [Microbotryum silenes-dioicae]|uniref:BQ5605_C005g03665 protein n=2 Tax=Microbotryum silenes-dioicae TaxID=796604 RepID=A0A2X0MB80_9BASI|nr:BQ5605_C005g03665 [Microbotryum silenes-dioicae]
MANFNGINLMDSNPMGSIAHLATELVPDLRAMASYSWWVYKGNRNALRSLNAILTRRWMTWLELMITDLEPSAAQTYGARRRNPDVKAEGPLLPTVAMVRQRYEVMGLELGVVEEGAQAGRQTFKKFREAGSARKYQIDKLRILEKAFGLHPGHSLFEDEYRAHKLSLYGCIVMSPTSNQAALEPSSSALISRIHLSDNPNSYEEWSVWISNHLRRKKCLDVTTVGIPALLAIYEAALVTPSTSQATSAGAKISPAAPRALTSAQQGLVDIYTLDLEAKDDKAAELINNTITGSQMKIIKNCVSAHEMWTALRIHHTKGAEARFIQLVPVIFRSTFTRSNTSNFKSFVSNFLNAVEEISTMGVPLPGFAQAALLVHSLPPEWESIASSLTTDLTLATDIDSFIAVLYAQVDRKMASSSTTHGAERHAYGGIESALAMSAQSHDHSKVHCKSCNVMGHSSKWAGCPSLKKAQAVKEEAAKAMFVNSAFCHSL